MSMYMRLLLLALGWRTRDPFESEAARAVRRYLARLLAPTMGVLVLLFAFIYVLVYAWDVPGEYVVGFLGMILWFWVVTRVFLTIGGSVPIHDKKCDQKLTEYVTNLATKNGLRPVRVYRFESVEPQALMVYRGEVRILVASTLTLYQDPLGMIGILAHELAHRELPLGTLFPRANNVFIHHLFDKALIAMNKRVMEESHGFIELQKMMHPSEATRRLAKLSFLHLVNRVLWHLSSAPALQLREHACDAIAVLLLRHCPPLIFGLSTLRRAAIAPYIYQMNTHPPISTRITTLRAMEERLSKTPSL